MTSVTASQRRLLVEQPRRAEVLLRQRQREAGRILSGPGGEKFVAATFGKMTLKVKTSCIRTPEHIAVYHILLC
jgi:hypothetical protein